MYIIIENTSSANTNPFYCEHSTPIELKLNYSCELDM